MLCFVLRLKEMSVNLSAGHTTLFIPLISIHMQDNVGDQNYRLPYISLCSKVW